MKATFQQLISDMKKQLPGAVATGAFSITDGLMLAVESDVPDTNMDAMSAIHAMIWERVGLFMKNLPTQIAGSMRAMILETEAASFYILVDDSVQIALMAAVGANGNLGMLRLVVKNYLKKIMAVINQ